MEIYNYSCDAGSVQILIGESLISFPNSTGDGGYKCFVFENYAEYEEEMKEHARKSACFCMQTFKGAKLLSQDCFNNSNAKNINDFIIRELNGRFMICEYQGDFAFVQF